MKTHYNPGEKTCADLGPVDHPATFVRVTEHGSTFYRVTCRLSGAVAMYWPSYLKDGHSLAVWEVEPPRGHDDCHDVDHVPADVREVAP